MKKFSLIALVASLIAIFTFFTGIPHLPDLQRRIQMLLAQETLVQKPDEQSKAAEQVEAKAQRIAEAKRLEEQQRQLEEQERKLEDKRRLIALKAADVKRLEEEQQQLAKEEVRQPQKYILKPTQCRGDYGISMAVIDGDIYQDRIKVVILHKNFSGVNEFFCLLNPRFDTYLADDQGNRYPLININGIAAFDTPSQVTGYTKVVKGVPCRYELDFDAKGRVPKELNFTATYYQPDMVGVLHFTKTASCSNIQVLSTVFSK